MKYLLISVILATISQTKIVWKCMENISLKKKMINNAKSSYRGCIMNRLSSLILLIQIIWK